jgi:hypothetical protein
MYRNRTCLALPAALALLLAGVVAHVEGAVGVDGRLDDWGVILGADGHLVYDAIYGDTYHHTAPSWWNPPAIKEGTVVIANGRKVTYQVEDYLDNSNNYFVGPQYGGQNYDAEFLGVAIESGRLHIALATGQRPDNNLYYFSPGDILIKDSLGGVYGIELGGWYDASGDWKTGDRVITNGERGATYTLNSNGFTTSATPLGTQVAGSVWKADDPVNNWIYGKPVDTLPVQLRAQGVSGAKYLGLADLSYNFSSDLTDPANLRAHAFIELSVELKLFGDDVDVTYVRWGPSCGNDELSVDVPPPTHTPEPASLLVWAVLALAFGGCSWRKWRRHVAAG